MVPGVAINQHSAHWAIWDNSLSVTGDPSSEILMKNAGFAGIRDLLCAGDNNLLAMMKQQMADVGYHDTSNWVISIPMPSLSERARVSLLARNAGIDHIRLVPTVAAVAAELCWNDTVQFNESVYNLIIWNSSDMIEICLVSIGVGVLEYFAYGARRYKEEKQIAGIIRKILIEEMLPTYHFHDNEKGTIFMNPLPSDARDELEHLVTNAGWKIRIVNSEQTELYGCMRLAAKISGYTFTNDFLALMITEYSFKVLKNDHQVIEIISQDTTIPTRYSRPDKKHPCKIYMSDITDRFGMVTILVSCPFSPREHDLIRIPVYEIWDGKHAEEEAQVMIDMDANMYFDITISNISNNKKIVYSWKEIYEQICAQRDSI